MVGCALEESEQLLDEVWGYAAVSENVDSAMGNRRRDHLGQSARSASSRRF